MSHTNELYKKADYVVKTPIAECPVCGSPAELWQYSENFATGIIHKVVMCTNGDSFHPQDGFVGEGCLLYMPPNNFYRGRYIEAIKYWNEYAKAVIEQRNRKTL